MVSCSAYGCSNTSSNAAKTKVKKVGVTFHGFPQNPERRAQWIRAVRRKNWSPSSHSKLCSDHFKEEDLDRTSLSCVRVRDHGVPTLFPSYPLYIVLKQKVGHLSRV
uniref:THAP domain-containing protein 2 n=1 Tax=Cacopsylla melanoneura TaxID=428564 RepID=A0A8D8ZTA6_9HEMI